MSYSAHEYGMFYDFEIFHILNEFISSKTSEYKTNNWIYFSAYCTTVTMDEPREVVAKVRNTFK